MTAQEMSNLFDVKLNSYFTQRTFGNENGDLDFTCDEYEKSVFLTDAQNELVRCFYSGARSAKSSVINLAQDSYESDELARRVLSSQIKTYQTTTFISANLSDNVHIQNVGGLPSGSFHYNFVTLPTLGGEKVWYIVYEEVKFSADSGDCTKEKVAIVEPCTVDELDRVLKNPFRRPNNKRVLRLDIDTDVVELVSAYNLAEYTVRYLAKPTPIVTASFPSDISIDGVYTLSNCELSTSVHDIIVDAAVQLAYQSKIMGRPQQTQGN